MIMHKLAKYVFCQIVITAVEENKKQGEKKDRDKDGEGCVRMFQF